MPRRRLRLHSQNREWNLFTAGAAAGVDSFDRCLIPEALNPALRDECKGPGESPLIRTTHYCLLQPLCTGGGPMEYPDLQPMIFSRDYIGYLARRTVKHLIDAKLITTSNLKVVEARVAEGLIEELSLEDRINEEVRVILEAYSEEMRKSGAQYAEMFKKVKTELAKKYKAVL
jgi:hypothetical protein